MTTTTTAPSILAGLEAKVLEPAGRELSFILRDLRRIDPSSPQDTADVAQRLRDWSPWGETEVFLTREAGLDAWRTVEQALFLPNAFQQFAFELAILGLPRMLEPEHEQPCDDLADAIGAWYHRLRSELRDMAGSMEAT